MEAVMYKSLFWLIVFFCLPLLAQSVNIAAEKEAIKKVCRMETMAFVNRDGFTQRSFMTDDHEFLRITYNEGTAHGSAWHKKLDPNKKDDGAEMLKPYPFEVVNDDYIFHINGDLAWVSYLQQVSTPAPGRKITYTMRENRTLRKEQGKWKIVAMATLCTGSDDPQLFHIQEKLTDISNLLIDAKDYDKALRIAEVNLELFPESSHAYDALAWAWYHRGDKEKTILYAKKALEQIPKDNFTPQYSLEQIKQWAEGKFELAEKMK